MDKHSYLSNGDVTAFEELYQRYKADESSVDFGWQKFFEGFELASKTFDQEGGVPENFQKEFKVINLINGYRQRGHLFTETNPVRERRKYEPSLEIVNFGLEETDLDLEFQAGTEIGIGAAKLRDIVAHLKQTYCNHIGVEFMYMRKPYVVGWLQQRMEANRNTPTFNANEKKHILTKLNEAVAFEQFLHTKFVGQKRFSLEGCETFIPAIDAVIERGAELGIEEFVVGMAHRGRLNVLTNVFQKSYEDIFFEFEGNPYDELSFGGDVKYHLGYSSDIKTASGKNVHLSLSPNPSHLEAVDPLVEGMARAKIDHKYNGDESKVAPIIVHGDASIAGQGVVYEVIQMSLLEGYKTGGTIHMVINNQIGFTTNYLDARSSTYCTDIGKVTLSPVFHVNADDVESLVLAVKLAMEFRQTFHRDVFIDILGYRKHGHNEGDEPKFTQPLLYKAIAKHSNPWKIYSDKLIAEDGIDAKTIEKIDLDFRNGLQDKLDLVKAKEDKVASVKRDLVGAWAGKRKATQTDFEESPNTGVTKKKLTDLANKFTTLPDDRNFFRKVKKLFADRQNMLKKGEFDWAMGEHFAYASLLAEGTPIRFTGQDVQRGTFSHRHAAIVEEDTGKKYIPLNHMSKNQAELSIYNSLLSEFGVLGFEYGYASVSPNRLVIWEAQFGDFSNETQVIMDQFISAAEDKWLRQNGLVMLLPHGYEGQGAEHSSARLERYLQLCAELNMQVLNCTTPANLFHAFRRQLAREFRKPMMVFTPKSLLRHPKCTSKWNDFTKGGFKEVIDDETANVNEVDNVIFCTGKIYYDLLAQREQHELNNFAIVRIEQLYPLAQTQISNVITKYKKAERWLWVQEEPENMGAWTHIMRHIKEIPLKRISRQESAAPATGSSKVHQIETYEIFEQVFERSYYKEKQVKEYLTHFVNE